jgi:hypothetical protein
MQPFGVASRWAAGPLAAAAENFTCVVLDPADAGGGGCRLERDALLAALGSLDERLTPRVPGFIWEG